MNNQLWKESRGKRVTTAIVIGALLGAVGFSSAVADVIVQTNTSYLAATGSGILQGQDGPHRSAEFLGDITSTALSMESGTGGEAFAYAAHGVLKANAIASAVRGETTRFNAGIGSQGHAAAGAEFNDSLLISSQDRVGAGILHASLLVDADITQLGSIEPGKSFFTEAHTSLFVFSGAYQYSLIWSSSNRVPGSARNVFQVNGEIVAGEMSGVWDIAIPFNFDEFFDLRVAIGVDATSFAGVDSTAITKALMGDSVYWGGISAIELPDGTRTTDFDVSSFSGHGWRGSPQSVPTPSSLALLLAGLAVSRTRVFRRRSNKAGTLSDDCYCHRQQ